MGGMVVDGGIEVRSVRILNLRFNPIVLSHVIMGPRSFEICNCHWPVTGSGYLG